MPKLTAQLQKGTFHYTASINGNIIRIAGPKWFINALLESLILPEIKKSAH